MVVQYISNIVETRHPSYLSSLLDWRKWRIAYNGGDYFRKLFLRGVYRPTVKTSRTSKYTRT